jgi:uncharacterized protein (DUF1778 family)
MYSQNGIIKNQGQCNLMANPKDERINIRATPEQKETLSQAANLKHATLSSFVMQTAYEAAQAILLTQTKFALSATEWDAFCAALDSPPKQRTNLARLLNSASILEAQSESITNSKRRSTKTVRKDNAP